MTTELTNILDSFKTVRLEEMDKVRLMDRFDTKFLLPAGRLPDLLKIMESRYKVLEVNGYRISSYNTVYLDTPDFLFFNQHVTDRKGRLKIRFRNYNSTGITFLEIKKKTKNDRTVKWRIENSLSGNTCDESAMEFINSHFHGISGNLRPVLVNNFKRITLISTEVHERVTLDLDLSFAEPGGNFKELLFLAVAELKSDGMAVRSPFSDIVRQFSLFSTGFSKYCVGIAMLHDLPRKNILKPKLLLLNRIENEYNGSLSA